MFDRMKKVLCAGCALLGVAACADVVTNENTYVVDVPTTLNGVTNIWKHPTVAAKINADLTLENRTYLRFTGANVTGKGTPIDTAPCLYVAQTDSPVTIEVIAKPL